MATGPREGASGAVEDVKGGLKKAAGALTGNERMEQEGAAQQRKADAEKDAAAKEAQAEAARAEAAVHEADQRAHQP